MTIATILKKTKQQRIGKTPVVFVPLDVWHEIEDRLENLEMMNSVAFRKKITKARKEKKFYTLTEVKKGLGL